MKKIEAVIFPLYVNTVRMELHRRGIRGGLTVVEVQHSDSHKGLLSTDKGASGTFQDRVKLELIVDDSEAEKVVNIILRHAQPESDAEGGHIAVLDINETLRIGLH